MDFEKKRKKLEKKSKEHLISMIFDLHKEIKKIVKDEDYYAEFCRKYEEIEQMKESRKTTHLEKLKYIESIADQIQTVQENDYSLDKKDVSEVHVMEKEDGGAALIITSMKENKFKHLYIDIRDIAEIEEDEAEINIYLDDNEQVTLTKGEKNYYVYNPQSYTYVKVEDKDTYNKYMKSLQEVMKVLGFK